LASRGNSRNPAVFIFGLKITKLKIEKTINHAIFGVLNKIIEEITYLIKRKAQLKYYFFLLSNLALLRSARARTL